MFWILTLMILFTGPKIRFPIRFVFQNVTFPHISYTYLAEDRATFHANEGKVEKILPYPTDFLHVGNSNFYLVIDVQQSYYTLFGSSLSIVHVSRI